MWNNVWDSNLNMPVSDSISKVLLPMPRPVGSNNSYKVRPLLIFWYLLHPEGKKECFFEKSVGQKPNQKSFNSVWIFSISSYLRGLSSASIELEMLDVLARMKWLDLILARSA
jgi:hypothetical protein